MTERSGAAYRIKATNWKATPPGTSVSYPGGDVTSSAQSGHHLLESIHGRTGAHHARVEEGNDVYEAGPYRTQYRSQVAAASLSNRIEEHPDLASKYHKETYR